MSALSDSDPFNTRDFDAVLSGISARLAATAAAHDAAGSFPFENFRELHAHGLIAAAVPRRFGGGGADLATASRIVAAVARGEPATALVLAMTYLQHHQIGRDGCRWPRETVEAIFASAVRDGALVNALRVEPALGTPARGGLPATTLQRTDGGWLLNGHKIYGTGSPALAWMAVWARTDESEPRVGVALVHRDGNTPPGVRVVETWNHLGLRASGSHDVMFERVFVPDAHAVDLRAPSAWADTRGASQADVDANAEQQAWMAVLLGALYNGVAHAGLDWLTGFLSARIPANLGAPLATLPRMQEATGHIAALLQVSDTLLAHAASAVDAGSPPTATESGVVKHVITANAIEALEQALRLAGNHGLTRDNPLERHYRDALCGRIHTPQADSVLVAAGRRALGLD